MEVDVRDAGGTRTVLLRPAIGVRGERCTFDGTEVRHGDQVAKGGSIVMGEARCRFVLAHKGFVDQDRPPCTCAHCGHGRKTSP